MTWLLVGLLWWLPVWADQIPSPPPLRGLSVSAQRYLRTIYNNWQTLEVVTTSPNGTQRGRKGRLIAFNDSGTWKLCLNTTDGGGTTWLCTAALTSP